MTITVMRHFILTTILIIQCCLTIGQEVKIITDKQTYKFDEIVTVTFNLNAKSDSISMTEFDGFNQIGGSEKSSSTAIRNGELTESELMTFTLSPLKSGELKIFSPTYFVDGEKIQGQPVIIKVETTNLTPEELKEKKNQGFIEDGIKPVGTTRIYFHEDDGYIEIFNGMEWQFHKKLNSREIKKMSKIKN